MSTDHYLSVFTPSNTLPEDLEAIFVQREALLADSVERVVESAKTENKHYLLFAGSRGSGKTHFVSLLVHRLSKVAKVSESLRIAWLPEDQTNTSVLDFIRAIYWELAEKYPEEYSCQSLEPMYDLDPDQAFEFLSRRLLEDTGDKTILIVVENLDALFGNLGKEGQESLRAFIQENPIFTIVATAQKLIDAVTKRDRAFFGFFQTESLKPLLISEANELLQNIAKLRKRSEVVEFLRTPEGEARVRALHHLSGGNHRVYIVLSQFITKDSIDALVEPFLKMVDEMTPYYQERIRWLSGQQRKIIEFLCNQDRPVTVKHIAKMLFTSEQSISSQLNDLKKKGYVIPNKRGRETLYEISEPLMRICTEVKDSKAGEPLRLLVDFLRVWYSERDLQSHLEGAEIDSFPYKYFHSAISKNEELGNLRAKLVVENFAKELGEEFRVSDRKDTLEKYSQICDELGIAYGKFCSEDIEGAIEILESVLEEDEFDCGVKANALFILAECGRYKIDFSSVEASLTSIIRLECVGSEDLANALLERGWLYETYGRFDDAIKDFDKLAFSADFFPDVRSVGLYLRIRLAGNLTEYNSRQDITEFVDEALTKVGNRYIDVGYLASCICIAKKEWKIANGLWIACLKRRSTETGIHFLYLPLTYNFSRDELQECCFDLIDCLKGAGELHALSPHLVSVLFFIRRSRSSVRSQSLENWISAWESAGSEIPELTISLRILRTGIEFIKSGCEDRGILLDLIQEERAIAEQALWLDQEEK